MTSFFWRSQDRFLRMEQELCGKRIIPFSLELMLFALAALSQILWMSRISLFCNCNFLKIVL